MEYYSLNQYLRDRFGKKIYKLSLNGGMTCPNRDGTISTGGCIFCSAGGSGDFAASPALSITEQIEAAKKLVAGKRPVDSYIAYFQAFTNTYAPVPYLRKIFTEAVNHPDIVALSIGTRPDCLPEEVLNLLAELNEIKPVWVELGLQTIKESTAIRINRGYPLPVFEQAVSNLKKRNLEVVVHVILGLPGETKQDMLATVSYVGSMKANGIKLQLLHVLKDTKLAEMYEKQLFEVMTQEDYTDLVVKCLKILPEDMVIHRMTGDGPKALLIAPLWSCNKRTVLNELNKKIREASRS